MKRLIIILAGVVTLFLLAAILIPMLFQDEIHEAVNKTLDENLEADVYFDPSQFGISLFKNFPDPTITLSEFGIVGQNEFEGDTLLSVGSFNITIDLFSLFGDSYEISSITLVRPRVFVQILEDGTANYEIYQESSSVEDPESTGDDAAFNLSIKSWQVTNGFVQYMDNTVNTEMIIEEFNHSGSGDISSDIYDLRTQTNAMIRRLKYDGISYFNGQLLNANLSININMLESRYTFNDNSIKINDFPFAFDGWLAMPNEDVDMDITFATTSSDVKSLFSLIPGAYTQDYAGLKTGGELSFSGYVKGTYSGSLMPAFGLDLKTIDGLISYPDLPAPIDNINIDMKIECADGIIDNTLIDFVKLRLNIGNNPIDGSLVVHNLRDYRTNADIKAKLNLEELETVFPMQDLNMKGQFELDLKANGIYDSTLKKMPTIEALMTLNNGYIKSSEFPKALEDFSFRTSINSSGDMETVVVNVEHFALELGDEKIEGNMQLVNPLDPAWELDVKGGLDLQVLSDYYPVEGMTYSGLLHADIETKGKYSDVEAERYNRFPTKGTVNLSDFEYISVDLPHGMVISESSIALDPKELKVNSFAGKIGRSDLQVEGSISNYIEYIFVDNSLLKGDFNLTSNVLDINEWMTSESVDQTASEDTSQMEVVVIPQNIDFQLNSSVKNIYYDNLHLTNAKGTMLVKDGALDLSNLSFDLLGGNIVMNGTYSTKIPDKPYFDYNLDIQSLSIPSAFSNFSTVRTFAPVAKHMNGNFSTNFNLSGFLKRDMSPAYESLLGSGLIKIAEAQVNESQLVSGLSKFMKSELASGKMGLKDVIMKASIENGRAHVAPFDISIGGHDATIAGSIGADGSLDYVLNTEVEAGVVGQQVNQMLSLLQGGGNDAASSKIKLNFNIAGTYDQPAITLAGSSGSESKASSPVETAKAQVEKEIKEEVSEQAEVAKEQVEEKIVEETDKLMEQSKEQIQPQVDSIQKKITEELGEEANKIIDEEFDSTANELKKSIKSLFKKKKKN